MPVRTWLPADRAGVLRICADTACFGRPAEEVFPDRELVAGLLLNAWLDAPGGCVLVAEEAGEVRGYAVGAADAAVPARRLFRRELPRAALRALLRGHWLRPAFWRLLSAALCVAGPRRRALAAARGFPAECHLNLDARARRRGLGSALLAGFLDWARRSGAPGVHVSVTTSAGQAFFARRGFALLARHAAPQLLPAGAEAPAETWIMGRALDPGRPG